MPPKGEEYELRLENVTFRNGDQAVMPRSPLNMDSIGQLQTQCAPTLGWNTNEVLEELGYSQEEIAQLQAADVIRGR